MIQKHDSSNALVSVIIPSYNHARFVGDAISSVLSQDYPNIELIVIDDGSTDGSVELLRRLSDENDFRLICQTNQGVCKTLNRAIRDEAKGRYVALLASDDRWRKDKIRLQMEMLREHHESEFCFSKAMEFSDRTKIGSGKVFPAHCRSGWVVQRVFVRQHVPAGTMLFSKKLYNSLGGFDETLKEEDWDFVIRCAARTPFVAVDKPLLYYRTHSNNTMLTLRSSAIFHQKAKILAKNFNLVSPYVWLFAVLLHFIHDIVFRRFR